MKKLIKLHYIGKLEKYIFIRTDNPLKEIWEQILLLSDYHFLSKNLENPTTDIITTISTCIKQAHEYYLASKSASLITRPLLIYYCFLSLVKAVLYLSDKKPDNLHGLSQPIMANSLLDVSVKIKSKGIFSSLAEFLGYKSKSDARTSLEQFVTNMVELKGAYRRYYGKSESIISPEVEVFMHGDIKIFFKPSVFGNNSREDFKILLEQTTNLFDDFKEVENETCIELNIRNPIPQGHLDSDGVDLMKKHFSYSIYPDYLYYLNLVQQDRRIPSALAYFGSMFILGSVVRYYPNDIDRFLNDQKTSNAWFIHQLCDNAERVFPNLMLNHLFGNSYKFAASTLY